MKYLLEIQEIHLMGHEYLYLIVYEQSFIFIGDFISIPKYV